MLDESKYIDGSTLIYDENNECEFDKEHYHNWDCNPSEINEIKNIKNIENNEYNEDNDIKLTTMLGNFSSIIKSSLEYFIYSDIFFFVKTQKSVQL